MLAKMGALPAALRIPDGPEKLVLPPLDLPVSSLMKLDLPLQRKSTTFIYPSDYISDLPPTLSTFELLKIPVPPSAVVKDLASTIINDPGIQSIVLAHSLAHRNQMDRYPLWLATLWSQMEPVRAARATWRTAVDQLHENLEKPSSSELAVVRAKAALQALDRLPFSPQIG